MLRSLRASASSWVVKILFLLLVASFAVWGIGDIFRAPTRTTAVAEINGVAITGDQFLTEFRREMNRLQSLFGGQLDTEQARKIGLDQRILDEMISRTLFNVYANEIGMTIPDELLVQRVRSDRTFQNDLGVFDRGRFQYLLQRNGLTEDQYFALLRRDVAREQLLNAVTTGVQAPDLLAKKLHTYRAETRMARTLLIPSSSSNVDAPTEAELATFHKEQADRYQAPEYRSVTVVELSPKQLADEIAVSDEELRAAYDERRNEFNVPERRHIEQILLPDEAAAKAAEGMLRDGKSFAEVAESTTGAKPIDLGTVERATILEEIAEPAFSTPEGQVSAPVESPLGWHLLHVVKVEPARTPGFEDVRDGLREELAMDRAVDTVIDLTNRFEDALAGGASIEEAAQNLNLDVTKIDAVSAGGQAPDGSKVEAIAGRPVLLSLAFSTPEGQESALTETADGGYAVLRVDSVTPPSLQPLESVRARVVADWEAARRSQVAEQTAKTIAERVRAGEDLAAIAAERGLSVAMSQPFRRDTDNPQDNIPAALAGDLFGLDEGGVATAAVDDGHVVAQLAEIRPADPNSPDIANLRDQLSRAMSNDLLAQFDGALRQRIEVEVNQDAINALF